MKRGYLIILTGQGDTDIRLANAEAKEWIESAPPAGHDGAWEEEIPAAVCEGQEIDSPDTDGEGNVTYDPRKPQITIGSYDNDRALACPGIPFDSVRAAMRYATEHDIEIVGEYHGCIY